MCAIPGRIAANNTRFNGCFRNFFAIDADALRQAVTIMGKVNESIHLWALARAANILKCC